MHAVEFIGKDLAPSAADLDVTDVSGSWTLMTSASGLPIG